MSFEPPRTQREGGVPGYLVVLGAFSVLVFLLAVAMGLIGFGIIDLNGPDDDPAPTVGVEGQDLQSSGFTLRDSRAADGKVELDVNVSVTNTSDDRKENIMMLVQCLDGGNVSNSQLIMGIDPDQTLQFELTLFGTGAPQCADPVVSFDEE